MSFLRLRKQNSRTTELLAGTGSILIILLLWQLVSSMHFVDPLFLPGPIEVIKGTIFLFTDMGFLNDILVSLYRVGVGYFLSIALAVPLGLILGSFPFFGALFLPINSFFRFVPVSAFVPLLILWFGIGDLQKIVLIVIGVTFYLLAFVIDHVRSVRQEYVDSALTLGSSDLQVIYKVILPASYKPIYDSIRTLFGGAWTLIVLAELVAAQAGIGKVIIDSQRFLHTDRLIGAIIVVGMIGYLFDYVLKGLEPLLFPWETKEA